MNRKMMFLIVSMLFSGAYVSESIAMEWVLGLGTGVANYFSPPVTLPVAEKANPLHEAAYRGEVANVIKLLDSIDINSETASGKTALYYASAEGRLPVVKVLLERDAWQTRTNEGEGPIHAACDKGHCEVAQVLLKSNKKLVNAEDNDGFTPLHNAAFEGHSSTVNMLLLMGADANKSCNRGRNALHYGAVSDNPQVVTALLKHGTKYQLTHSGATPFFDASKKKSYKAVKALAEGGIDLNAEMNAATIPSDRQLMKTAKEEAFGFAEAYSNGKTIFFYKHPQANSGGLFLDPKYSEHVIDKQYYSNHGVSFALDKQYGHWGEASLNRGRANPNNVKYVQAQFDGTENITTAWADWHVRIPARCDLPEYSAERAHKEGPSGDLVFKGWAKLDAGPKFLITHRCFEPYKQKSLPGKA